MESTRFRHKPIGVLGVECSKLLAAAANGSLSIAPQWVQDAIFAKRLEVSAIQATVVAYPLPNVPRLGSARDWLLHDPVDDTLNICPPETLAQFYERVE